MRRRVRFKSESGPCVARASSRQRTNDAPGCVEVCRTERACAESDHLRCGASYILVGVGARARPRRAGAAGRARRRAGRGPVAAMAGAAVGRSARADPAIPARAHLHLLMSGAGRDFDLPRHSHYSRRLSLWCFNIVLGGYVLPQGACVCYTVLWRIDNMRSCADPIAIRPVPSGPGTSPVRDESIDTGYGPEYFILIASYVGAGSVRGPRCVTSDDPGGINRLSRP